MIALRTEQQIIQKSHPMWKLIDEMCFNSKNLYNYANYIIRQEFINSKKYIIYGELNKTLKTHQQYKDCMSQPANCTLRLLDKTWKSFFNSLKEYQKNPNKFLGRPQIPKYLKKMADLFGWFQTILATMIKKTESFILESKNFILLSGNADVLEGLFK